MSGHENLAAALAALQADLPHVDKAETATVPTKKGGSYSYSYAGLPALTDALLPALASHGLSFIAKPRVVDGTYVLAYSLLHVSGEREDGEYLLPANASAQEIGSAITYGRRYCLCAVTGVAPDDDDDGRLAQNAPRSSAAQPPEPELVTEAQRAELGELIETAGVAKWVEWWAANHNRDIDVELYEKIRHTLGEAVPS